ncbi:MAG: radical SAM family heme chaperone HemW [Alistipes sp.]|nr:radical SAM family heme chaperone HemW [Alistipes sp.]
MSALYFHIPFCKRICSYCDFPKCADLRLMPATIEAMHREMDNTRDFLHDTTVGTIYFGGGTPSLLPPCELQRFIDHAADIYDLSQVEEITAEVNPDDIDRKYVSALRTTDIGRISVGIQSFDDDALKLMNRRHTAKQAEEAVKSLQDAGYGNITVDIIFGIEGFGDDCLRRNLEHVLALGIQHVSAYHLTIEPSTRFGRMAARGDIHAVDEERSEREFRIIHDTLTDSGFEHYEVSNYALGGYRSRHNSSYWLGTEYLGIGAGAHSFNGNSRRWCEQSADKYVRGCEYVSERLDERDRRNETVMTSLRRIEGIDLADFAEKFGAEYAERLAEEAVKLKGYGVECDGNSIRIPPERMLVSDAVIESLFDV